MINFLIVTNIIFNLLFGLVCFFISFQFIKNHKKLASTQTTGSNKNKKPIK